MDIFHGNCLDHMLFMEDNSVDAIVTDPPYGLSFMGKKWDYDVPGVDIWTECLRVLKPGGILALSLRPFSSDIFLTSEKICSKVNGGSERRREVRKLDIVLSFSLKTFSTNFSKGFKTTFSAFGFGSTFVFTSFGFVVSSTGFSS